MQTPALLLAEATTRFDDVTALDRLSMEIPAGILVGLIGPSGSGKTTTVRLLTGGLAPTSGTVRVLDEDPRQFRRSTRRRIGYMPQHFSLYPDLTAHENVDFMASLFGMLLPSRRRRVPETLRVVDLWEVRGRRAGALSGGMQRRLELAVALVHDPVLLFLDEPTAGLDPLLRAAVLAELRRLRDAGRTILVTTQYVTEAEECDMVALIADGRRVALGSPAELRRAAVGGEQVDLRTTRPVEVREWAALPGVTAVSRLGPTHLRLTVGSAAAAIPALVEAVNASGNEVTESVEQRPSFDDVFAALVTGRRADDDAAPAQAVAAEPAPAGVTAEQAAVPARVAVGPGIDASIHTDVTDPGFASAPIALERDGAARIATGSARDGGSR